MSVHFIIIFTHFVTARGPDSASANFAFTVAMAESILSKLFPVMLIRVPPDIGPEYGL